VVRERLTRLEQKGMLTEGEERERAALCAYIEEYERDWEALGEEGREAVILWRLLDGQRVAYGSGGIVVPGEISFPAIDFVFDLYGFKGPRRREVFERIMAVEGVVREVRDTRL
jgi:hypothetical protein